MQLAIQKLWHTGFFHVIVYPNDPLFYVFWFLLALGVLVQWLLFKRAERACLRWTFAALLLLGLLAGEIGTQIMTGWDMFLPMLGYWACLALLLGAVIPVLIRFIRTKVRLS